MVVVQKRYPLHPACKLFPILGDVELRELADDIKVNGLHNPIVLLDGKILDGRNRHAACKIANVEPSFENWKGKGSPVEWVISQNLMRRHLTASQRAVIALDILPMLEKEAKERQRLSSGRGKKVAQECATSNGKASEAAARIVRSSARYVEMVKEISKQSPELVDRIRSGELNVLEAKRMAGHEVRRNGWKRRRTNPTTDDISRVIVGDCMKLIPTLEDSLVGLVLTSPPYAEQRRGQYKGVAEADYADWTVRWMGSLWDKLADNASVLIVIRPHLKLGVISDYVLLTRLALREDGWFENEELIWLKPDAPPLGSTKRPRRTWESILWFSKSPQPYCDLTACGKESNRLGFDGSIRFGLGDGQPVHGGQNFEMRNGTSRCSDVFVAPVGTIEKGIDHPAIFPESLAEQLILTFSRDDDLVLDCFCGAGSTLCAAKRHSREYMGFDRSKKYVKIALNRLAEINV
jgi:site-specific DNA-methyltransferase (adenine-specific)/site-specific DNA-methyltransferase (cytosine-N4-specific)